MFSRSVGFEKLSSISANIGKLCENYRCHGQLEDALEVLQQQINVEEEVDYCNVHWLWKLTLVPHSSTLPNGFVLQASVSDGIIIMGMPNFRNKRWDSEGMTEMLESLFQTLNKKFGFSNYILGVSLDTVRTLLDDWVLHHGTSTNAESCQPRLRSEEICFTLNQDELDYMFRNEVSVEDVGPFVIYKCQHALQQHLDIQCLHFP